MPAVVRVLGRDVIFSIPFADCNADGLLGCSRGCRLAKPLPCLWVRCGRARNADFWNMPIRLCTGLKQVVRDRTTSAYSERLKKREERIGWPVTAGTGIYGRSPRECFFFESEVGMKVYLRSLHLLVTEPESDDREID